MTLAFIICAVIAGIFLYLWLTQKEELDKANVQNSQLNNRLQEELKKDSSRDNYMWQTSLKKEDLDDVLRDNGFVPHHGEDGWIYFKKQGDTYVLSTHSLPYIQFYKGFDCDTCDIELFKQAAQIAMNETWLGRITFSDEDRKVAYRVFAVERSQSHFCLSFMDYINMLDDLVACHTYYYNKLLNEKATLRVEDESTKVTETPRVSKVLS